MEIYPAIDLMDGRCVRLSGGDFNARTSYGDDPLAVAKAYEEAGARWLHVVDLDGARDPAKRQGGLIESLAKGTGLKMQTGGGVRSAEDVDALLALGVARVIVGSMSVRDPDAVKAILHKHGSDKIVLAFDVKGDFDQGFFVTTSGWTDQSDQTIEAMLKRYDGAVKHVLCTDISRDGKLGGPNTALYQYLCDVAPNVQVQASGGVAHLDDLSGLKTSGAAGVVIGKALYEKKFTLAEALQAVG